MYIWHIHISGYATEILSVYSAVPADSVSLYLSNYCKIEIVVWDYIIVSIN